ncbi:formylglycine-generating enzyme family protein [Phaeodactylibacter xiamenensis]|uniref:formylglycine-generating enzyme family protein n=1 Tax=Phaeodactylibacter xiamenensis TaxID=1524460 RepID=UPI0024A8331B|nr:formylglycine-generating enzyme family protein [Phaeodactylibacter xiamenensis]
MKNVKWHNGLMIWMVLLLSVPEKHIAQDSPVVSYLANYYEMLNNYGDTTLSLPDRRLFKEEILSQFFLFEGSLVWNDLRPQGSRYIKPREYLDNLLIDFSNGISFSHEILNIDDLQPTVNGLKTVIRLRVTAEPNGEQKITNELNMVLAVQQYSANSLSARIKSIDMAPPVSVALNIPELGEQEEAPSDLEEEVAAWEQAKRSDNLEGYEAYLEIHPEGLHATEARRRLQTLRDNKAWDEAKLQNTEFSYTQYLETYPDGLHINEANARLKKLEQKSLPPAIRELEKDMVRVEGGYFKMGCEALDYRCDSDELPAHGVELSTFLIGRYEVTQAQWEAVMGYNPSAFNGCPECPVEQVSWEDIQDFLEALNRMTNGSYRLPTEAEWEYAARGGQNNNGFIYAGNQKLDDVGWYNRNSRKKTYAIGSKSSNELSLYDMSGNVWEWCSDWYSKDYYSISTDYNPKGPSSGTLRVIRGGSWFSQARYCRVSSRIGYSPDFRGYGLGFRVVAQ